MKPRVRNRNRTRNIIFILVFLLSFSLVLAMNFNNNSAIGENSSYAMDVEPVKEKKEATGEISFGLTPRNTIIQTQRWQDQECLDQCYKKWLEGKQELPSTKECEENCIGVICSIQSIDYEQQKATVICEPVDTARAIKLRDKLSLIDREYFNIYGIPVENIEGNPIAKTDLKYWNNNTIEVDLTQPGRFKIGFGTNEFVITNALWTRGVFNYTNPIAGNISINATFTSGEYFSELMSPGTTSQPIINVSFTSTEPAGAKIGIALRTFNESFPTIGTIFENLTAYWKFDSSNVTDYSNNDNQGTIIGLVNPVADGKEGYRGSYDFAATAGEGSYISVPAHANFTSMTDFFTLAAWIYPTNGKQYNAIITKGNGGDNDWWWGVYNGDQMTAFPDDDTSPNCLGADGDVTLNAWNFVTLTYNESGFQNYVNGQLSGGIACTFDVFGNAYDLWIGESDIWDAYDNDFVGMIDELAIWNRSLSPAEISTLFEAGLNNWSAWSIEYYSNSSVSVDEGNYTQFRANLTQVDDANAAHLLKVIVGYGVAAPPAEDIPQFANMEMQSETTNEDQDMKLNITVTTTEDDINSVWLFWQGVTNYTYPYHGVYNDTTATTEFWVNITSGNYTAHDVIGYQWWANTSSEINSTQNYTYTIANQVPSTPSTTSPTDHFTTGNRTIHFAWGAVTDADAEDTHTYYIYINDTQNGSTASTTYEIAGFADANYEFRVSADDGYDNSTNSTVIYFNIDTTGPTFTNIEMQEVSVNEDEDMKLNATVASATADDINSVWVFIQGDRNYTYPYSYVYNDTTTTTEFWINLTSGNYSAHQTFGYQWWANTSTGIINATENYTYTIANQVPSTVTVTEPVDHLNTGNTTVHFAFSATDADAADTLRYFCFINTTGLYPTYNFSTTSTTYEVSGFADGSYNFTCWAWDGYDNSTANSTTQEFNIDTTGPTFTNIEMQESTPNEYQEMMLNITVTSNTDDDINSVWIFWQGTINYTYPYSYVYNDTTATTEFWINITSGNYTAHDVIGYEWWANTSTGVVNATHNYTYTIANQIPTVTGTVLNETLPLTNDVLLCSGTFDDNDAEDSETQAWHEWWVNNVSQTTNANELHLSGYSAGDTVICSKKVYDGYDNSSWYNSSNVATLQADDVVGPQFATMERTPDPPHEDQGVMLNITVTDASDVNSVWIQWNGTLNWTYPYGYVYNDTSATTEFWINVGSGNYTAHDPVSYSWWGNDSIGNINRTDNYTFTVANQVPTAPALNYPTDHNQTNNKSVVFKWVASTDADAEDTITYYGFINTTGALPTYNFSTTGTEIQVNGFDDGDYRIELWAFDEYDNSTTNSTLYFTVDTVPPQFTNMEMQEASVNEDEAMKLNITVTDSKNSINSVWIFVQGDRNYTYPYSDVYNDTTAIAEFWINLTSDNYSAHQIFGYEWWANDSVGNINATHNYTYTIANQLPSTVTVTEPTDHLTTANTTIHFAFSSTDNDAEDTTLRYYLFINGTYNASTTSTSLEVSGFDEGNYNYTMWAWDGYDNSSANSTARYFNIDTTPPNIDFVDPTPTNGTRTVNWTYINVTTSDANNHSAFVDWNRSMVLWMDFDTRNSTGHPTDRSTWLNNATSVTDATYTTAGARGGAFEFDGVDDAISLGDNFDFAGENFTICAWVNPTGITNEGYVIGKYDVSSSKGFWLRRQPANKWSSGTEYGSDTLVGGDVLVDQWQHVCVVLVTTGTDYFYVNGVQTASSTLVPPTVDNSRAMVIGNRYDSERDFDGTIDEVMIFNRNLSATEIVTLYNATKANGDYGYEHNFTGLNNGNYTFRAHTIDIAGNINSTELREINVSVPAADTTGPQFSNMERQEDPNNEDEALKLNITVTDASDVHSVWVFIQGDRNYTYPYSYVYNDTTATTEFWINLTSGNYSAHQTFGYQWWANDSLGNINATQNYTYTIENQVPTSTNPALNETAPATNDVINCSHGTFSDNDAEDSKQSQWFRWWFNNVSVENNSNEFNLQHYGKKGDTIICSYLVYDGYDNSTWYNSTNVATVANSIPSTVSITEPTDHLTTGNRTIHFAFSATDADAEDTLRHYLFINGTYNDSTTSTTLEISGFADGNYNYTMWAWDGTANSTANSTTRYFNIDTTGPTFTNIEMQEASVNEDEDMKLNATVASATADDMNSVWVFIQGDRNYTYPYSYVYNDTTATTEFWINLTSGNYSAHQTFGYQWWANTSTGIINATENYTYTIANQVPSTVTVTEPTDHLTTANTTIHFAFSSTDNDAEDTTLRYYLFINGTYNASTTSASLEVSGFDEGNYNYTMWTWDGYDNSSANSTARYFNIDTTTPPILTWSSELESNNSKTTENKTWIFWNFTSSKPIGTDGCKVEINTTNQTGTIDGSYCYYNETSLTGNQTRCAHGWANDTANNWGKTEYRCITTNEQQAAAPPEEEEEPGGGVGPEPEEEIPDFEVTPNLIDIIIFQGKTEARQINVTNTGNLNLTIEISFYNLTNLAFAEIAFDLATDESKNISIQFIAPTTIEPGIYSGSIVLSAENITKNINVVVEIIPEEHLLDMEISIPEEYKRISAGAELPLYIELYNLGKLGRIDLVIDYEIKDSEGNITIKEYETKAIETTLSFVKTFIIPEDAELGNYTIDVVATYDNVTAMAGVEFTVIPEEAEDITLVIIIYVIIIAITLASMIMLLYPIFLRKI